MTNKSLLLLLGAGSVGLWLWKTWKPKLPSWTSGMAPLVQGKNYRFQVLGHPGPEGASAWAMAVQALLQASGAKNVSIRTDGVTAPDAVVQFDKVSPATLGVPVGASLYPNDPPLASSELVRVTELPA